MPSMYLVLDMQNDLVAEEGPNGKSPLGEQVRSRGIVGKTRQAIAKARASGVPIGFVRVGFSPDYRECPSGSAIFSAARCWSETFLQLTRSRVLVCRCP